MSKKKIEEKDKDVKIEENIDKQKKKEKKEKKVPKEISQEILKKIFKNLLKGIIFMIYFIVLNMAYLTMKRRPSTLLTLNMYSSPKVMLTTTPLL